MQQRQLRLGDILDDYCPRERRLTNHAVVAMVGPDVKQTRCTTCDAEHEYKHAKVPRQRKKTDAPAALYAQALTGGPKRVAHDAELAGSEEPVEVPENEVPENGDKEADQDQDQDQLSAAEPPLDRLEPTPLPTVLTSEAAGRPTLDDEGEEESGAAIEEGPVHRPLIRATLPRPEGQPPPTRPAPEFTIRQPGGRANRFRPRHQRGGPFGGNRSNGNMGAGPMRGGPRPTGGRPPQGSMSSRGSRRHGPGRKRSK